MPTPLSSVRYKESLHYHRAHRAHRVPISCCLLLGITVPLRFVGSLAVMYMPVEYPFCTLHEWEISVLFGLPQCLGVFSSPTVLTNPSLPSHFMPLPLMFQVHRFLCSSYTLKLCWSAGPPCQRALCICSSLHLMHFPLLVA